MSPFLPILIYIAAYITAFILSKKFGAITREGRCETIDGLRGFLAIGVFIHHAAIWQQFATNHVWQSPKSNVYNQIGLSSVMLFFMITSFLFTSKLLNAEYAPFDWRKFFFARFKRLAPMYYFSLILLLIIVAIQSDFTIKTSPEELMKSMAHWALFALHDSPDINQLPQTSMINAGVIWSLSYEWLFYFSLPLFAFLLSPAKSQFPWLLLSIGFISIFFWAQGFMPYPLLAFAFGVIPAFLKKYRAYSPQINQNFASILIIGLIALLCTSYHPYSITSMMILAAIFFTITLGSDVFGFLKNPIFQFLGDISYSTYLLHGILLYAFFNLVLGIGSTAKLSSMEYAMYIVFLTPLLVLISYLCFRYIESPFLKKQSR